jgi:hypothetical protein
MTARSLVGLLRDARGFTLLEAVVASVVFMTIVLGMATLYTTSQQAYNYGTSQAYLQRVGTLLQERIQRELVGSIALQTVDCGPNSTANLSVMYVTPGAGGSGAAGSQRVFCLWQQAISTPPGPQLFRCQLTNFAVGDTCQSGTTENMLTLTQSQISTQIDAPLRVANTQFMRVSCLPASSGACGDPGRQVVSPLVDVRFDLSDGVNFNAQAGINGLRFAFSLTPRN